jgi:AcrR family transcriptional regulator
MGRAENTLRRRREILEAALVCFHALGYEKTTLSDISETAGASIGSIYHLFTSKEQLFAALYLEAIAASQDATIRALRRARNAEEGVRALVCSYLRWVSRNRELAGYLLTMRRAEFMSEAEPELDRLNAAFHDALRGWIEERRADDALPDVDLDLVLAILGGPTQDFARRWLVGQTSTSLREASETLARAAWLSLSGLAQERAPRRRRHRR